MLIRLTGRTVNLAHMAMAEDVDAPPGGMRLYLVGSIVRDVGPEDAARLRRRFAELDPEPLPGEAPGGWADISGEGRIRERSPAAPAPKRRRRT